MSEPTGRGAAWEGERRERAQRRATREGGASRAPRRLANQEALSEPQCHDEVCITCSDTAVPVTIVRLLDDGMALVDAGSGKQEEVSVALVSAGTGDTILVHAREAIAVVG